MKIKELLSEATIDRPLELRDVVKFFPNTYVRVIKAKWGGGQLMFQGHPFFGKTADGARDLGSAYTGAEDAVDEIVKDEDYGINIDISMDLSPIDGHEGDQHDFSFETPVNDKQEVYLGYSPKHDCLYIGYDAWIDEETFNQKWDEEFQSATGDEYDSDNPEHEAVFKDVWDRFKDSMMFGLLFRIDGDGSGGFTAEEEYAMPGGFYKGIYRQSFFKNYDLIDLRLN